MYNTIIVPLDGKRLSESALPLVKRLVRDGEAKKVILVRAVAPTPDLAVDAPLDPVLVASADAENRARAERYLQEIVNRIPWSGIDHETVVLFGRIPDVLIEYAKDSLADLIVMATQARRGISRLIWGSVADQMLRSAGIPLLLIGAAGEERRSVSFPHRWKPAPEKPFETRRAA
jgi:nucleotide-binding universal stress UspA family protein